MGARSIEQARQIRTDPEVGVGSYASQNEEQRRRLVLAIEGKTYVATPFKARQAISAGKPRHTQDIRLDPRCGFIVAQKGACRGRQVGVAVGKHIVRAFNGARQKTYGG